jgi:hypothetical protein
VWFNWWLHVEFGVEKDSFEITDDNGWWYGVQSDLDEFISWREFAEVCCRAEPHCFSLLFVELKAFRSAPVIYGRRTSPKPSSHLIDLIWLVLLSALCVVGIQMVTDAVLLEYLSEATSIAALANEVVEGSNTTYSHNTTIGITMQDHILLQFGKSDNSVVIDGGLWPPLVVQQAAAVELHADKQQLAEVGGE